METQRTVQPAAADTAAEGPTFLWQRAGVARRRGVITIAHGDQKYLDMAKYLARSIRLHDPECPMAVVTDSQDPELRELFDLGVALRPEYGANVEQKVSLDRYTPFEETLFIDSDCLAVRSLEGVWPLFEGRSFSVVGEECDKGPKPDWGIDFAEFIARHGLRSMPNFNGGVYFFRKDEVGRSVFDSARQIMREYDRYGFRVFRGGAADEPIFALAQAKHGIRAVEDKGAVMRNPDGLRGPLTVDVLLNRSRMRVNGQVIQPAILHFCGNWRADPVYWREKKKLDLLKRFPARRTVGYVVNALFYPPQAAFVLSVRGLKRVLRFGRRPNHPASLW